MQAQDDCQCQVAVLPRAWIFYQPKIHSVSMSSYDFQLLPKLRSEEKEYNIRKKERHCWKQSLIERNSRTFEEKVQLLAVYGRAKNRCKIGPKKDLAEIYKFDIRLPFRAHNMSILDSSTRRIGLTALL